MEIRIALLLTKLVNSDHSIKSEKKILSILHQKGLREILQTILIHVVKDAKPLEYFHTLFHHHALPSVTTLLYHDSEFGDSKLI